MSARTPERRNKQSTCCSLAEILFSRGLRGTRGCAQVSRACHAGGACSPLTGRRADIKWPLHLAECLCNEILRMVPRLPRSLREIQICLCEIKNCVLKFGVLNHGLNVHCANGLCRSIYHWRSKQNYAQSCLFVESLYICIYYICSKLCTAVFTTTSRMLQRWFAAQQKAASSAHTLRTSVRIKT